MKTGVSVRSGRDTRDSHAQRKGSAKAAISTPREEASRESKQTGTLILDFSPPELGEDQLGFSHSVSGILLCQPKQTNTLPVSSER